MSGDLYVCEACKERGKDFSAPVDEIGAALMQEHLKAEHHIVPLAIRTCSECGHSVGVLWPHCENTPITCKDHSP